MGIQYATGGIPVTPGAAARALDMSIDQVMKLIDRGELEAEQNPRTRRWYISAESYNAYARELAVTQDPEPARQSGDTERILQQLDILSQRIGNLAAIVAKLASVVGQAPPEPDPGMALTGVQGPEDRRQLAAIAVNRDRTAATLADCAAQIATMKTQAGVASSRRAGA